MNAQIKCPKCKAMHFNIHASDLATGKMECYACGHVIEPKLPLPIKHFTSLGSREMIRESEPPCADSNQP